MQESSATLRRRIRANIARLGKCGIFMSGTFVRKGRKCGNPQCACAHGGAGHPACTVTSKVAGRTKAIYIPVEMAEEVKGWVEEHRKVKRLLKDIDALAERLIRIRVPQRLAESRRRKSLASTPET